MSVARCPMCFSIEALAARPLRGGAARECWQSLEQADAGILCIQPQEGELTARRAIVGVVERRQIRYAHMVGRHAADHVRGHASRLSSRRSPEPAVVRPDAAWARRLTVRDAGRNRLHRDVRSVARVGQDERAYQSRATGRICRRARCSRRRHRSTALRLRRHRRRLLQRQIRHPRRARRSCSKFAAGA